MPSDATSLARSEARALRTLDEASELALTEGEELVVDGQPMREKLLRYMMVLPVILTLLTGVGLLALPFIYLAVRAWVRKHNYWVTTSRVIVTNGIIGFRARSIPLERVSDVALGCNFVEKWMGLRSVIVRDMTGEAMSGASMMAAPEAAALQRKILDQVHKVNRRMVNDEPEAVGGDVYRGTGPKGVPKNEMLDLLRKIEQNTRTEE